MTFELSDPINFIIEEIADRRLKRRNISQTYVLLLKHSECRSLDWAKINRAIIERWSVSGLVWIKTNAWNGRCFK